MINVEKKAKELVADIANEAIKSLHRQGLLNEPRAMQDQKIRPLVEAFIKKMKPAKYDPCRKFKAGDMVSPCFWYDRPPVAYYISDVSGHFTPEDGRYEVDKDELPDSTVLVKYKGKTISMPACHLELMTPVEELELYSVGGSIDGCILYKNGEHYAEFVNSIDAERACKLLNAEWRKEQE